ncbi:hypothetical protein A8C56_18895 [Niabella ginsenosidivorans]|uniref:Uncharacterized protein n=1 Tax=Niabella ginsenosidivorans TaxID=1176587 RepID=A0A1A9I7V1_9BACT|nr:hypothetical protein A8C56_18895 [Niabella ginsenosidivorans]
MCYCFEKQSFFFVMPGFLFVLQKQYGNDKSSYRHPAEEVEGSLNHRALQYFRDSPASLGSEHSDDESIIDPQCIIPSVIGNLFRHLFIAHLGPEIKQIPEQVRDIFRVTVKRFVISKNLICGYLCLNMAIREALELPRFLIQETPQECLLVFNTFPENENSEFLLNRFLL